MTKTGLIIILCCLPVYLLAQSLEREVMGSEGHSATSGELMIDYTVGEPMISATTSAALVLTEGFQQPEHMASDSVWPGDANSDLVANHYDLLAIGIGYGTTGPQRPGASLAWKAQYSQDWSDTLASGTNYKHLDCDGDGSILAADTLAISQNYGLTHNKTGEVNSSGPPLGLRFLQDTLMVGDTAMAIVFLGNDTLPADSIYGAAFTLNYDVNLVEPGQMWVEYDSSWIGTYGADMLALSRNFELDGKLDMALTRINQVETSGFGEVARLCIIMIDDISGKDLLEEFFYASISDPLVISSDERLIEVAVGLDSLLLQQEDSSLSVDPALFARVQVFPNPTDEVLIIQLEDLRASGWILYNTVGQLVERGAAFALRESIDTHDLPEGLYTLEVLTQSGRVAKKVQIIH